MPNISINSDSDTFSDTNTNYTTTTQNSNNNDNNYPKNGFDEFNSHILKKNRHINYMTEKISNSDNPKNKIHFFDSESYLTSPCSYSCASTEKSLNVDSNSVTPTLSPLNSFSHIDNEKPFHCHWKENYNNSNPIDNGKILAFPLSNSNSKRCRDCGNIDELDIFNRETGYKKKKNKSRVDISIPKKNKKKKFESIKLALTAEQFNRHKSPLILRKNDDICKLGKKKMNQLAKSIHSKGDINNFSTESKLSRNKVKKTSKNSMNFKLIEYNENLISRHTTGSRRSARLQKSKSSHHESLPSFDDDLEELNPLKSKQSDDKIGGIYSFFCDGLETENHFMRVKKLKNSLENVIMNNKQELQLYIDKVKSDLSNHQSMISSNNSKILLRLCIIDSNGDEIKDNRLEKVKLKKDQTVGTLVNWVSKNFGLNEEKIPRVKVIFDGESLDHNMRFDNEALKVEELDQLDILFPREEEHIGFEDNENSSEVISSINDKIGVELSNGEILILD